MDASKATRSYKIKSSDGQLLYVEESGPVDGIPALFLHGGPGAGIGHHYQWMFAGENYRLIAFDQRGCGRSLPTAELDNNNTTAHLHDIEKIREFFGIDKWLLFGGSWGSTLALVYAIKYPEQVSAMVLRGIFLARKQDTDWFLSPKGGAAQVFPEQYSAFCGHLSVNSSKELCQAYYSKLLHRDDKIRRKHARLWFNWEGSISRLTPNKQVASEHASDAQIYALALMECYYLLHACFIPENYILENAENLLNIPCHIVHGRYDMVCKFEAAQSLSKVLPQSTLYVIDGAGHSMAEAGISKALTLSLQTFGKTLNKQL